MPMSRLNSKCEALAAGYYFRIKRKQVETASPVLFNSDKIRPFGIFCKKVLKV